MSTVSDVSDDECWYNESEDEQPSGLSKDLEDFRRTWESELRERRKGAFRAKSSPEKEAGPSLSETEKAKKLFLLGYSAEKDGKLADAIEYYRHAVLIDPAVEKNVRDELTAFRQSLQKTSSVEEPDQLDDEAVIESAVIVPCSVERETCIHQEHEQSSCHISELPRELLLGIMRWVITDKLDVRCVEQLSMTCRAFYFLARDSELWRLICFRTFGRAFENLSDNPENCSTWREMYIKVPHLNFNGCYISRVVYHRRGDISIDRAYPQWHSVEYYRYFRFFPDGSILTLTTSDDPVTSLPKLQARSSKSVNVIAGIYRVSGSEVNVVLEKTSKAEPPQKYRGGVATMQQPSTTLTYFMSFELRNRRYRSYLAWKSYRIVSRLAGGKESVTDFECSRNSNTGRQSFPSLFFSRVKSFAATCDAALV